MNADAGVAITSCDATSHQGRPDGYSARVPTSPGPRLCWSPHQRGASTGASGTARASSSTDVNSLNTACSVVAMGMVSTRPGGSPSHGRKPTPPTLTLPVTGDIPDPLPLTSCTYTTSPLTGEPEPNGASDSRVGAALGKALWLLRRASPGHRRPRR